jgi:hypothetical protein
MQKHSKEKMIRILTTGSKDLNKPPTDVFAVQVLGSR